MDSLWLYELTETGQHLWTALEQDLSEPQLVELLVAEFDVAEDIAAQDVSEFIGDLRSIGGLL